ncbi:mast cell protease 1A-like [Malaclemys terrapin pileata]|uniref:mast cell protease 1A-like n=1 Tax=Malaclemys terrapin pileata TaxID=2991368 RepID=UPI0023A8D3C9|nr:mast cell protease 1A-like [Malaclemys terrapin pileata]
MLILILLPVAFLLPSGTGAGEIIGGQEAQPHSRPYMAYLDIQRGNNSSFCGGFLMSKNFVLTAAHCNGDIITVRLGTHNLRNLEHNEQRIPVRRSIPHPRYNRVTINNDIMLLQLAQQARLSDKVQTVHLPHYGDKVIPGSVCSVAGWGQMSVFPGKTSDMLMEVDLEVMEDRNCSLRFPNKYKPGTMLCAGDPLGSKSSFQGDSGGPLVCGRVAQGIVSFGPNDASPPEVYTRVSQFIPWIKETMGKLQA